METTQEQPQLNKDDNPTVIQLQTIVIVNTTVVHGEHSTNDATTSSGEISSSSDNIFASNYNLFTGDTNKKSNTFLSCKKFAYILAIILTICFISVLFLSPIISYITRDTYNLDSDYETQMVCHNISVVLHTTLLLHANPVLCHYVILLFCLDDAYKDYCLIMVCSTNTTCECKTLSFCNSQAYGYEYCKSTQWNILLQKWAHKVLKPLCNSVKGTVASSDCLEPCTVKKPGEMVVISVADSDHHCTI